MPEHVEGARPRRWMLIGSVEVPGQVRAWRRDESGHPGTSVACIIHEGFESQGEQDRWQRSWIGDT